jgi:hypothetical protein
MLLLSAKYLQCNTSAMRVNLCSMHTNMRRLAVLSCLRMVVPVGADLTQPTACNATYAHLNDARKSFYRRSAATERYQGCVVELLLPLAFHSVFQKRRCFLLVVAS